VLGAHRVAYFLGYGVWPETARLSCGNTACCNPRHIVDPSQQADIVRMPQSELHTQSRHSDAEIRTLREHYAAKKVTQVELAIRYGATREWVGQVVRGERRAVYDAGKRQTGCLI
jgi:hypothetical protein